MEGASGHSLARARPIRTRPAEPILGTPTVRFMLGLIVSLGLMIGLVNLPWYPAPALNIAGWRLLPPDQIMALEELGLEPLAKAPSETPITFFENAEEEPETDGEDEATVEAEEVAEAVEETSTRLSEPQRMITRPAVLEFSDEMPQVEGGLGAFYLNIEYPEEARNAGIEGRLILDFIVETDGRPTNIHVARSLHPLCDSAAVRALRLTRFVPGRNQQQTVRVRMRLPVRFELVNAPVRPPASPPP